MPQLLSSYLDNKYLASFEIDGLTLTPDKKYILACSSRYSRAELAFFDAETGELKQELPLVFSGFQIHFLVNGTNNELFYFTRNEEFTTPRNFSLYRIFQEDGVFKSEKMPFEFSSEGYDFSVVFTPAAIYIARAEGLLVLDPVTHSIVKEIESPFTESSNGNAVSHDGKLVAFGHYKTNKVEVYDTQTGQLLQSFEASGLHDSYGAHLEFMDNSHTLIAAAKSIVELWNADNGKLISKIECTGIYGSTIMGMHLSPNQKYLTVQHTGRMLSVYDIDSAEQLWLESYVDNMSVACFSPDNEWVLFNSGRRIDKLTTQNGQRDPNAKPVSSSKIKRMYVLPVENRLLAFNDMQATHINATTGALELELFAYNRPQFTYNPHEPNSNKNLLCSGGSGASIGNANTGKLKHILSNYYGCLALSSEYVATCHDYFSNESKKKLQVHDLDGKNTVILAESLKNIPIYGIEFLGTSNLLAGLSDKFVAVWDVDSKEQLWEIPFKVDTNKLFTHESGSHIFVIGKKHALTCLNATDGSLVWEYLPRKDKKYKNINFKCILGRGNKVICLMDNGDLRCLDLDSGKLLNSQNMCTAGSECAALAPDDTMYLVNSDTSVMHWDIKDWLSDASAPASKSSTKKIAQKEAKPSAPFLLPSADSDSQTLADYFRTTEWEGFNWEKDAPALTELLDRLEQREGVTEAHEICTSKMLELQGKQPNTTAFRLTHRFGHVTKIVSYGISPDGRYLASGSWVGEDYEEGGELMIWDVKTGRCVNIIDDIYGGVGWPDYADCIQWSQDGTLLGIAANTNNVTVLKPFSNNYDAIESFSETDGQSRPPQWCWHPENKAVFIACWMSSAKIPGCVCPLDPKAFPLRRPYAFNQPIAKGIFTKKEIENSDNNHDDDAISPLGNFESPKWSSKGYVYGCDRPYAYTLDPQTRALGTVIKGIPNVYSWSPDGDYLLLVKDSDIVVKDIKGKTLRTIPVREQLIGEVLKKNKSSKTDSLLEVSVGEDGTPTLLFGRADISEVERIYWHPDTSKCLFAAVVLGEYGYLAIYQNFELIGFAQTNVFQIGRWDLADALPFAFSTDGSYAAYLSSTQEVSIWKIGETVSLQTTYKVQIPAKGILLGAENRLVVLEDNYLAFYEAFSGKEISSYSTLADGAEPVGLNHSPLGHYSSNFDVNPYFPYEHEGETHWIAAFETGLVICPEALQSILESELTYTIANRYVWPFRWGKNTVESNLLNALSSPLLPLSAKNKSALKKTLVDAPKAKNPDDYFLTVTKKELFGKNTKKGKYQLSDNSNTFSENIRNAMKLDTIQLALKKAKDYKAPIVFKGADINEENLLTLVGKVVLYTETYRPSRVSIGTVVGVSKDALSHIHIDFSDDGRQGGCGSSWGPFDGLASIGEAQIR